VKTMADVGRIVNLYELHDSYKGVARELNISKNTVKKYLHRVNDAKGGAVEEILPKERKIIQPSRVLTEPVLEKIRRHLESNLGHPSPKTATHRQTNLGVARQGRS
jgi:transposase